METVVTTRSTVNTLAKSTGLYRSGAAMDHTARGWREERYTVAHDLVTGEEVPIITGWTPDLRSGAPVMVMAVGDLATLVLDGDAAQLRVNIAATEDDLKQQRGRR